MDKNASKSKRLAMLAVRCCNFAGASQGARFSPCLSIYPFFSASSPKQPALIGPPIPYSSLHLSLPSVHPASKLQALVYDILPSTTAIFSYAIGSRKLSANKQFFVAAQTVVSLLQTTKINQDVSFIAANKVYTSTNKTTII